MPIVSIVFFIICASLLIYSGIIFLTKKLIVPIHMQGSVKNLSKAYVKKMALLITFLAIAPFTAAIMGLFIKLVLIPIIIFFVSFIALLIVGNKIIMKSK